jgi:5-methyltetrahydropteroyltriglutamate--homocysteine methyltransferase
MAVTTNLGMPRIGPRRELKRAVERYWAGRSDAAELGRVARERRADAWRTQRNAGVTAVPCNDFSLYDQVLDTCCLVGAVPERFDPDGGPIDLDTYFALARGTERGDAPVAPLEMTKWFDTNYHHLVPEMGPDTTFRPDAGKPAAELAEARALGIAVRPVLVGPVTFLRLAAATEPGFDPLALIDRLAPVYAEVLTDLEVAGAAWVQLDEPCLVTDLDRTAQEALHACYAALAAASGARLLVATYFGGLGDNLDLAAALPVDGLHVDLVRDPGQLAPVLGRIADGPGERVLSAGVVDGRNVWRTEIGGVVERLGEAHRRLGDRLWVGPSCSLQHVPHDLAGEEDLDPALRSRLAFARQKLDEIAEIAAALGRAASAPGGGPGPAPGGGAPRAVPVPAPVGGGTWRPSDRAVRAAAQRDALGLPPLPTTTIGSFPQTDDIRRARRDHAAGALSDDEYEATCRAEIARVIRAQEDAGLDVLVHGEPERNDMVQYFGERLAGFATTANGWVQSYGTRCVRPPILHADVSRPEPITGRWLRYAQSLTDRPVKGMLTGPVTILQWSFVREDRPRADTCRQIAHAIAAEVRDLEAAGTRIIQVDEPALREGLPLRTAERKHYLDWATECFRIATAGVGDATQVHTHMCYAEFGDILDAIVALDADVISIEAARSRMTVLDDLVAARYPGAVGPGLYDIHAPHVPGEDEMAVLLDAALTALPAARLWVNPDCGLKTRRWDEVRPALAHMVAAARRARERLAAGSAAN